MIRRSIALALLLLFLAAAGRGAARAPDWVVRAGKTAVDRSLLDGPPAADAVVLWSQRIVTAGGGATRVYEREAIRALNATGTDAGTFQASSDSDAKVSVEGAWTLHADGSVEQLDLKGVVSVQVAHPEYFTDSYVVTFRPPRLAPGDVAAYALSRKARREVYQWSLALSREHPIAAQEIALDLPDGWGHLWRFTDRPEGYTGPLTGKGGAKASYFFGPQRGIAQEKGAPPWIDLAPKVELALLPPTAQFAEVAFGSWSDVADWFHRKSAPARTEAPSDLLPQETADPRTAASRWVQENVRYVAVEIGEGGYVPREPALVSRRLYGDCKDKAFLLMALLRRRGVEAFPVLTRGRSSGRIDPEFPSPIQFNHLILAVRIPTPGSLPAEVRLPDGVVVLFDPTDEWTPWGQLPGDLQGARGLVVRGQGGQLIDFPSASGQVNRVTRRVEGAVSADGSLAAQVVEVTEGALCERDHYQRRSSAERLESIVRFAAAEAGGAQASGLELLHLQSPDRPMEARFQLKNPRFLRRVGGLIVVPLLPFSVSPAKMLAPGGRRFPVDFGYPHTRRLTVKLGIPAGHSVDGLPDPVSVENPFFRYRFSASSTGGQLEAIEEFEVRKAPLPVAELAHWKAIEAAVARAGGASAVLVGRP